MADIKVVVQIEMPQEYVEDWLRLLTHFDHAHPGCNIESYAEGDMAIEEVEEIMSKTGYDTYKMMKQ